MRTAAQKKCPPAFMRRMQCTADPCARAAGLLTGIRDLVDWGVEGGLTTPDQLRLAVIPRKAIPELKKQGLNNRKIAKLTGTSHQTVARDKLIARREPRRLLVTGSVEHYGGDAENTGENRMFAGPRPQTGSYLEDRDKHT
jgi:hypothetical protein